MLKCTLRSLKLLRLTLCPHNTINFHQFSPRFQHCFDLLASPTPSFLAVAMAVLQIFLESTVSLCDVMFCFFIYLTRNSMLLLLNDHSFYHSWNNECIPINGYLVEQSITAIWDSQIIVEEAWPVFTLLLLGIPFYRSHHRLHCSISVSHWLWIMHCSAVILLVFSHIVSDVVIKFIAVLTTQFNRRPYLWLHNSGREV